MQAPTILLAAHAFTFLPLATLPVKATLASRLSELQDRTKTTSCAFQGS